MDIYFVHGLNHKKEYPPISSIIHKAEDKLKKSQPDLDFKIHNLEILGYESGHPHKHSVSEMLEELEAKTTAGDSVLVGHSFGGLLVSLLAHKNSYQGVLLFQPWWQTFSAGAALPEFVRPYARDIVERILFWAPAEVLKRLPSPGGQSVETVTKNPAEYSRYKLLNTYPLTFFQDVIRHQLRLRARPLKCSKLGIALSVEDYTVDNSAIYFSRNTAELYMMDGLHQEVYDNPEASADIIDRFVNDLLS